MVSNNRINVIIPVYKAHDTILRALSSVMAQTIINDVDILLVNDGCPEGTYSEYVDMFKSYVSIEELTLEKNRGSSIARQSGIDYTNDEFIVFLDADDTFDSSFALQILRTRITTNDTFQCVSSSFVEYPNDGLSMMLHQNDMVWLFGKIYRRSFLEKYNIRFINARTSNQDVGFNTLIRLYTSNNEEEQICYTDDRTYCWHFKENSVTTINGFQFEYDQSICGWVDNMIYVGNEFHTHKPDVDLSEWLFANLCILYCKYLMVQAQCPMFTEQCWFYIKKYYHKSFKLLFSNLSADTLSEIAMNIVTDQYSNPSMYDVPQSISINQFLSYLMAEPFDEEEIKIIRAKLPESVIKANKECGIVD
jgi:glycosyltransferase involved in cell wall biosynthesis